MKTVQTKQEIDALTSDHLVVVDAYADWCRPCKKVAPVLEELEKKYESITFLKFDADECEELAQEMGVTNLPTVFISEPGEDVKKLVGDNVDRLRNEIEAML